ncbi:MAG TPA: hypothetical protein VN833_28500 [Candidatus Acidoferrales bacterium]|jgi:hypothetical protein|nr:hypothetical protein [Candidatus Acidoferrales bacterium]
MSLIHTCRLCGAHSFDYLTALQRHAQKLATKPAEWMPWNYRNLGADSLPLRFRVELWTNRTWPENGPLTK